MLNYNTNQNTYRIGSGTNDQISVFESEASLSIVSGSSIGVVCFVCGTQFMVAAGLLIAGALCDRPELYPFAIPFLSLGLGIAVAARVYRGDHLYFEKAWLKISDNELQFKNQSVWPKENLKRLRLSTEWIPNSDGGELLGWEILFENAEGHRHVFQFTGKSNADTFWNAITRNADVKTIVPQDSED